MKLYAVKDCLVGFMNPFPMLNDMQAIREFDKAVNSSQPSPIQENRHDMQLWCLADWDEVNGSLTQDLRLLIDGDSVYKPVISSEVSHEVRKPV